MAYPRNHVLLSVQFDAWSGTEELQFGLHFDTTVVPTNTAAIDTAIAAWYGTAGLSMNQNVRYIGYKLALIGTNGKYPPGHTPTVFTRATPLVGPGAGSVLPQQTLCISLKTALVRGRGHAGRIYPPPQGYTVGADGRNITSNVTGAVTAHKAFFEALVTAVGGRLVVVSDLAGTFQPVTSIAVGRVVDTQRKRRNHLAEEYQTASITNP